MYKQIAEQTTEQVDILHLNFHLSMVIVRVGKWRQIGKLPEYTPPFPSGALATWLL